MSLVEAFNLAPEYVQLALWGVVLFGTASGVRRAVEARFAENRRPRSTTHLQTNVGVVQG